jgi:hypothetical protein
VIHLTGMEDPGLSPMDATSQQHDDADALSLAQWYAEPMNAAAARAWFERIHQREQAAHARGTSCSACAFQRMIARFWLKRPIRQDYEALLGTGKDPRIRALLETVYGQLLLSRKLLGAHQHLQNGFALAAPYLAPADYFEVMRRNERLAALELRTRPAPAQGLEQLLREAAVVRQLTGGRAPGNAGRRDDTLG